MFGVALPVRLRRVRTPRVADLRGMDVQRRGGGVLGRYSGPWAKFVRSRIFRCRGFWGVFLSRRVCLWAFGVGLSRSGASRPPAAPDLRGRTPRRRRIRVSRGNRRRAAARAPGRVARSARSEGLPPAARRGRRALARRLAAVLPPAEAAAPPAPSGAALLRRVGCYESTDGCCETRRRTELARALQAQ